MNRNLNIKRIVLLVAATLLYSLTYAAGPATEDKDGVPLWSYLGAESPNMPILYHTRDGVSKPAAFGIEYKKGKTVLQEQIVKNFWKQYNGYCDSMHIKIFYCILFEENLRIEEIRFLKTGLVGRFVDEMEKCGYFDILEKEIANTKGKWERKNKEDRHIPTFVYFGWVNL
ncbi:MAG: hypothetical protein MJZ33_04285 [Paludibacteraceae bacterium]|nr:hypothetical protein [Paludibacteraceae bacterium]